MKLTDSGLRHLVDALRWRLKRQRLATEAATVLAETRALGFPQAAAAKLRSPSLLPVAARTETPAPVAIEPQPGTVVAATVCSLDHLHFALALATSLRRHHPEITLHVLVVDGDGAALPEAVGCRFLRASEVGLLADPYLALKFSAAELCCAGKPALLLYLAATSGASEIIYLDADIYLFAPMDRLLEQATRSNFVVFPHTIAPMPHPEIRWERPTLGQLAWAGAFNAGLFAFHVSTASTEFLAIWREMVTEPGASLVSRGVQTEQNSFNWVVAFADDIFVMRDKTYNVAYWNLHERSLRWTASSPDGPVLTVDGRPLVAYHFSGFSPVDPWRLALADQRQWVHSDRALGQLLAFYSGELVAHGLETWSKCPYRFGSFPSGIAIDPRMRELFKEYECELRRRIDPFSEEGEASIAAHSFSAAWSRWPAAGCSWSRSTERVTTCGPFPGGRTGPRADAALVQSVGGSRDGLRRVIRQAPACRSQVGRSAIPGRPSAQEAARLLRALRTARSEATENNCSLSWTKRRKASRAGHPRSRSRVLRRLGDLRGLAPGPGSAGIFARAILICWRRIPKRSQPGCAFSAPVSSSCLGAFRRDFLVPPVAAR